MDIQKFDEVVEQMRSIIERKNADYAGTIDNISLTGLHGVAVRLLDKVARIHSLTSGREAQVKDESIRDTLLDIANYAIIGTMLHDGTWAGKSKAAGLKSPDMVRTIIIGAGGSGGSAGPVVGPGGATGEGTVFLYGGPSPVQPSIPPRPTMKVKSKKVLLKSRKKK